MFLIHDFIDHILVNVFVLFASFVALVVLIAALSSHPSRLLKHSNLERIRGARRRGGRSRGCWRRDVVYGFRLLGPLAFVFLFVYYFDDLGHV